METAEEEQNQPKFAPDRIKFEQIVEAEGEDRISTLPDCLIIEILSRLPSTKDAIGTGTLSNRWKHLWTWIHTLSFTSIDCSLFPPCPPNPNSRSDFFSLVDATLTQCRKSKLKKFEVCSTYDIRFESHVKNWIRYAISREVEELILGFWVKDSGVEILLDQFFFTTSCFTDLTLKCCILNPSGAISWKNLRSLCISFMRLDENLMENILSGSPLLETLVLKYCCDYRRLDITSKSVKELVFYGYLNMDSFDDNDIIEINAPYILSLTIKEPLLLRKLLLLSVSSLVEANLNYTIFECEHWDASNGETEEGMLKGLILNLLHVKELKIGKFCSEVASRLEAKGFVFPSNIKFYKRSNWF